MSAQMGSVAKMGFEVMRALHKGQAALWQYGGGITGEVREPIASDRMVPNLVECACH